MYLSSEQIRKKANKVYPPTAENIPLRNAYMQGFIDGMAEVEGMPTGYFEQIATELNQLWPAGKKLEMYRWRDSVPNLVRRLEFIWKERDLKKKNYTKSDVVRAAKNYLDKFQNGSSDMKYMELVKYFIFKEQKVVSENGKAGWSYKSSLADELANLESMPVQEEIEVFENFGNLI